MTAADQAELAELRKMWADLVLQLDLHPHAKGSDILWAIEQLQDEAKLSKQRAEQAGLRRGEIALELHNLRQQQKGPSKPWPTNATAE